MFANIKNRFISAIVPDLPPLPSSGDYHQRGYTSTDPNLQHLRRKRQQRMPHKFDYARPDFLQLQTMDELLASADHNVRPIIVPRDISLLPFYSGYSECVNSGKSYWNEDQCAVYRQVLSDPSQKYPDLPYVYFGIFDGHAGFGAALAASCQFQNILHEKLVDCIDGLLQRDDEPSPAINSVNGLPHPSQFRRYVSKDELIIGALEGAFFHMDSLIAQDRDFYRDAGGCTACVTLLINGKMFVANAGDSRAILCQRKISSTTEEKEKTSDSNVEASASTSTTQAEVDVTYAVPFSHDHTPETERQRLLNIAHLKPDLMGNVYVAMEYARRPHGVDLGQRILCRQGTMKGWTYKTITREDLRMPVVTGEGKRSRLLGTLGVTRGFGDHDLLAINSGMQIKPFLTPHPDVNYRDLSKIVSIPGENNEDGDYGIIVMATDGLWDVTENEAVARIVFQTLAKFPTEKHRYTMVAQELVAKARGKINDSGHWRLTDSKAAATVDDISVIVIPIYQYYKEHVEWEQKCAREYQERLAREAELATEAKVNEESLTNGIATNADIELENDDDEEEIVVEVNRENVQAKMDIEEEPITEEIDLSEFDSAPSDAKGDENLKELDDSITEAELNAAATALEATTISTPEQKEPSSPQRSPEKSNSSKPQNHQQQQRGRNRKDKR